MKYIIVKQDGPRNCTFKVTNPDKIKLYKKISLELGLGTVVTTTIIEEGDDGKWMLV